MLTNDKIYDSVFVQPVATYCNLVSKLRDFSIGGHYMYQKKNITYLSIRVTKELLSMFSYLRDLLGVEEYYQVLERAEKEYIAHSEEIDQNILNKLKFTHEYTGVIPASFKIRVDSEIDSQVNELLKQRYQIKNVRGPWKIKICLQTLVYLLEQSSQQKFADENINSYKIQLIDLTVGEKNIEKIKKAIDVLKECE